MVEHVGEAQIDEYARQIARVLEPGGRVLNHGIVAVPPQERGAHIGGEFSNRYVFPDGELLNLSRMMLAFERAGFEALNVENLHTDYAETLRHWTTRFEERLDEAERLAGTERLRVWRLYLRAARNSLRDRPATPSTSCSAAGRSPRAPAPRPPAPATSRRAGEFRRSASRPETAVEQAGPHRLLGLELPRLARGHLPGGPAGPALAGALRGALRHGRGQRDLLPAALREARSRPGPSRRPRRFVFAVKASRYLTHVKRLKAIGAGREAVLRAARAAGRGAASSGPCCGSFRRTSSATTIASARRSRGCPRGRHCFEFRHPSWFTRGGLRPPAPPSRRAGDRRPPRAALPDPRDHRGLDLHPLPLRAAAAGAATTPSASSRSGSAGSPPGAPRSRSSPTSTTTGRPSPRATRAGSPSGFELTGSPACGARSALSTRSATASPVKPTSSRRSAGLPWVT